MYKKFILKHKVILNKKKNKKNKVFLKKSLKNLKFHKRNLKNLKFLKKSFVKVRIGEIYSEW